MKIAYCLLYVFSALFFFGSCGKTNEIRSEIPEYLMGKLPSLYSSRDLNRVLEKQGYGGNVISYSGSPIVWFVHESIVFCDRTKRDPVYVLQKNGKIKVLPGIKKGNKDYYFNDDLEQVNLQSPDLGPKWKRNYEPVFDKDTRYIGYNYLEKSQEKKDWKDKEKRYLIVDIKTNKIVVDRIGNISYLQATNSYLYFRVAEKRNNNNKFKRYIIKYDLKNSKEKYFINLENEPEGISESMIFSYYDIDADNGLMACAAYAFPGRFFFQKSLRTKVWIYDINKKEYVYSWYPNRKEGGHIQVMFLPDSLRKLLCSD